MYNHKRQSVSQKENPGKDPETGLYPYDCYDCSTYTLTFNSLDKKCASHYIRTKAVRALVLDTIQRVSTYAIENRDEFIQKVRETSAIQQDKAAKELKRKVARDNKRSLELDMAAEQAELDAYNEDSSRIDQFLALTEKYTDFSVLTTPMINEFVDKILVHAPYKDEFGDRCQEVEIYLKFIGKFEVPMPEPTAEDLVKEEKARKRRAYLRKKSKERYARLKAEREAAAEQMAADNANEDAPTDPTDEMTA